MKISEIREKFPMYKDVPDEQLVIGLHRKFYSDMPFKEFHKNVQYDVAPDPTEGMSGLQKVAAGANKAVTDIGRGIRQVSTEAMDNAPFAVPEVMRLLAKNAPFTRKDAAEQRAVDAPLMESGAAKAGNIAGNIAAFLPSMFVPGANTYAGAALTGGLMAGAQPVVEDESRTENVAIGAGAGLAGQGIGNAIGRALRPVQSTLPKVEADLAQEAMNRGIPLRASQLTGSKPLKIVDSVMENLPFTSGPQLAQKQAQQQAFNRAVGKTFGSAEDALTPEVMGSARSRIGGKFTELAGRNTLQADDALMSSLAKIDEESRRYLTPDVGRVVLNRMDDVLARIENGTMSGKAYRNLDSELGKASREAASGDLRNALGGLRGALRDAMDRSITEADSAAWKQARREYANLMTVAPIAGKNELGDVSGRTLLSAANKSNSNAKFGADSELAELGRVGRAFVAEQIPNSGTAQRLAAQGLLTGGGALVGGGASLATGQNPLEGMAIGAGVTAGGLLSPRVLQMMMNSPAGQAYLTQGIMAMTPAQQALLTGAGRAGAMGLIGNAGQ